MILEQHAFFPFLVGAVLDIQACDHVAGPQICIPFAFELGLNLVELKSI
jgi:hypothetical protein